MPRPKLDPNEETIAMSIRLPLPMREKLKEQARLHRRSLSQEIVWLLGKALENAESKPLSKSE